MDIGILETAKNGDVSVFEFDVCKWVINVWITNMHVYVISDSLWH